MNYRHYKHFRTNRPQAAGFTLIEILVVVGIVALLAGILLPVLGRARESGRQTVCTTNLHQLYMAANSYRTDFNRYPSSVASLLPPDISIVVVTGRRPNGDIDSAPVAGSTSYLKDPGIAHCPDDAVAYNTPTSSYEYTKIGVWNYFGYDSRGAAQYPDTLHTFPSDTLMRKGQPYNVNTNPVKYSLSNSYTPAGTVVTHCRFHRPATSGISDPDALYNADTTGGESARDLILRVDGTVKSYVVGSWNTPNVSGLTTWQLQNF